MILVDSSVWSLVLRRRKRDLSSAERAIFYEWRERVIAREAAIIGVVRQEVLSGIASRERFEEIRGQLDGVYELPLERPVWDQAARFYTICERHGVAPGTVDMTICGAAYVHGSRIFTTDPDFVLYAKHLPIKLHRWELAGRD